MPLPINRPPTDTYHPRFTLTYRKANAHGVSSDFIGWFPTLDEARAHVHDNALIPVTISDAYTQQTGKLFPSGTLRWNRGTTR